MYRDFAYVEDLVRGIRLLTDPLAVRPEEHMVQVGDGRSPVDPHCVMNIDNSSKVKLLDFIDVVEDVLGKKAIRNYMPMQMGDVPATWAEASLLQSLAGYRPKTDFRDGIVRFVDWFRDYHNV